MKRYAVILVTMIAVWILPKLSHPAKDIGKLEPVEAVLLHYDGSRYKLQTDTGHEGTGKTLEKAVENLVEYAPAEVFLETTDKLLIEGAVPEVTELLAYFRPSCRVCRCTEVTDLQKAAEYLTTHPTGLTLNRLRGGYTQWEWLDMK